MLSLIKGMSDNTNDNGYVIQRLTKDNIGDMARLYTAVYGKTCPKGFFEKKYDSKYTGVEYIGYLAYSEADNTPIAFYGVIPCFMEYDGTLILAAQSTDTMTHPEFRFKGMFVELSNLTFALCRENNIKFIFGFPNQNSLPGAINKLGWKMTETMDCFIVNFKSFPIEAICRKVSFLAGIYKQYKKRVLRKYIQPLDGIVNSVLEDGYGGVSRGSHYLSSKKYSDTTVIKIKDNFYWLKITDKLIIGDMLISNGSIDEVIRQLTNLANKLGIREMQCHFSTQTRLHDLFRQRFVPIPSFHALFQDFGSSVSMEKFKFTFADIDIF
jgi:hypothetical protein